MLSNRAPVRCDPLVSQLVMVHKKSEGSYWSNHRRPQHNATPISGRLSPMRLFGFYHSTGDEHRTQAFGQYCGSLDPLGSKRVSAAGVVVIAPNSAHTRDLIVGYRGTPRLRSAPESLLNSEQIASLFAKKGSRFLDELCGAFSLAIVEPDKQLALLAVDPLGIERMTYWRDGETLVFGDRTDVVAHAPGVNAAIVDQRIYDFLFFHMIPAPQSVFEGVNKLEPGTALLYENGESTIKTYWRPQFRNDPRANEADFAAELREALELGVRDARPDAQTGAFLSGGLDSSTVAGYLGKVIARAAPTFSIGFGVPEYDELKFARIANEHFGCSGHEYNVTAADVLAALPIVATSYDEPFGNSSAVPVLFCARLAKQHGFDHLLAGDGGDELFAGNQRYAQQKLFELYGQVPAVLRDQVLSRLVSFIHPNSSIVPLRKLRSYVDQASIPLPIRLETWNYAYREGVGRLLSPEFAASIDVEAPMRQMTEVFERCEAVDVLDRELAYDWHFTLADNDLRKVTSMCELAGVKVSYPMLDHRLVDLSMRVPASMKMRGLALRSFYKRAMRGFLPDTILNKEKHGFGLPFGTWLKSEPALAEMIYTNLSDLKKRRMFRDGFIDDLISQQQAGHHGYYGYFVWDLAILEQWLAHQSASAAQT